MSSVADLVGWCRACWRRVIRSLRRADDDGALVEELASHIALHTDDSMRRGMGQSAA